MTSVLHQSNRTSAPHVRNGAEGAEQTASAPHLPFRRGGAVRNLDSDVRRCGNEGGLIASDQAQLGVPQDARNQPGDVVIGIVEKKAREAYEVRLRHVRGGPTPVRSVLLRLCRKIPDGRWMPMNGGARCGVTIPASRLSEVIDLLERAEDCLADEGALPQ